MTDEDTITVDGLGGGDVTVTKESDGLFTVSLLEWLGPDGNAVTTVQFTKAQIRDLISFLSR